MPEFDGLRHMQEPGTMYYGADFDWLPGYEPTLASYRVQTCLVVPTPAHVVWQQLTQATQWPHWFPMTTDVVLSHGHRELASGMTFKWRMQGVRFNSTIYQFQPFRRLAWRSSNPLLSTCHIWLLEQWDSSTRVITDETHRGLLPRLLGVAVRPRLEKGQQEWLESLATRIGEGLTGTGFLRACPQGGQS